MLNIVTEVSATWKSNMLAVDFFLDDFISLKKFILILNLLRVFSSQMYIDF